MRTALWLPACAIILGVVDHYVPAAFWPVACIAFIWLVAKVEALEGPPHLQGDKAAPHLTLLGVTDAVGNANQVELEEAPLYMAGPGGVEPITDWFTARIGGQRVLILEHTKDVHGKDGK